MKLKHHLTLIALASVLFYSLGYAHHEIKIVKQPVMVETQVPVCKKLYTKPEARRVAKALDILAAAIPERALRP